MVDPQQVLTSSTATAQVDQRHWRVLLRSLHAVFRAPDLAAGAALVARVARAADDLGHHPDLDLRYGLVHVRTTSHDVGGLTARDVALAQAVTTIADDLGLAGDPAALVAQEVAIDALDIPAVLPFWQAVLGYVPESDAPDNDALVDPAGLAPAYWFQQMDAPRPQRNRIHLDVTVPHDEAEARVAAAVAAGGRVVSADRAPASWVLADAEGNEACICTWQDRPDS
jgi:4a-hydroxytetrahydrobiopterin dehydratase